jgi:hypothetical protein
MGRNRRAAMSTVLLSVIVALAGSLVLFLGSTAQAAGRPAATTAKAPVAAKTKVKAKGPSLLSEVLASDPWVGDDFGWSVSVSGSTAVVGAPYSGSYAGAAYVFTDVAGTWIPEAELTASDADAGDEFGYSVNISGSTIVVGSPGYYDGIGDAYIFTDSGGTWTQQAELADTDPTGIGGDKFGYSVVTSGSVTMVGAKGYLGNTGAVYVFTDSGGSWTQTQKLSASDGAVGQMFGWSMTTSGTQLVVSAVKAHDDTGAVYVFTDSAGIWTQQAELWAADGFAENYFGDKVAISGKRIVVGAPGHDNEQGAVYVFLGSGATWKQVDELTAADGGPNDCFGWAIGVSGKTVLVGAEQTNNDSGAAYVFKLKGGSKWSQQSELTDTTDGAGTNEFGYSAYLSGTTAIISADQAEDNAGTAFIYKL